MAKMRTRRMSLSKALLDAVEGGAQPLHLGGEILQFGAAHECAALGRGVVRERLADAARRIQLPARQSARGVSDALRGDVADQARKLFLGVPAQVLGEVAQLVGKGAGSRDAVQRDDGGGLGPALLDATAGGDGEPQWREPPRGAIPPMFLRRARGPLPPTAPVSA